MMPYWLALGGALVTGAAGQVLLKIGAASGIGSGAAGMLQQLLRPATMVGFVFYFVGAMLYIIALRKIPVSVAFPCAALQYLAVAVLGWIAFKEPFAWVQAGGLLLILVGVSMLALSARPV
jgi:small multidrug resistance pump